MLRSAPTAPTTPLPTATTIAKNRTPQTFEKRRREAAKQKKRELKAAERRERNALKKAIADGTVPDPETSNPTIHDPASLQPEAYGVTPDEDEQP